MSQCIDGKTSHNVSFSSLGYRLTGKTFSLKDASARCSNHMRCSFRLNSTMVKGSDSMAKFKALTTLPSTGLYIDHQNLLAAQVNQSLPHKRVITERINGKVKSGVLKCTQKQLRTSDAQSTPRISRINEFSLCLKDVNSATLQNLSEDGTVLESCSAVVSKGTRKEIKHGPGRRSFYAPTISSTLRLIASRDAKEAIRSCSQDVGTGSKKCNLKNSSCSSISEVTPSGCSHFTSIRSRRDTMASKIYLGESSTSIAKNTSASSNKKLSGSLSARLSTRTTLKASNTTNRSKINDALTLVKPLEHSRRGTTRRTPAKGNLYLPFREAMVAQVRQTKSLGAGGSSSRSFDNELSSTCHNVSGRRNFLRRNALGRPTSRPALGSMLTLYRPTAITDFHSGNNTERTVEPLMMLERTERSQGQTSEHIIESESNLPLRRLSHHDRHREMRMDIDNMSYEELLELVEKIGSVSTGLTDEALAKCLKQNKFKLGHFPFGITDCFEDGYRCSICQEECADGEDIGELACEHWYHVFCITQWLKQKNWCPICKSPACAKS